MRGAFAIGYDDCAAAADLTEKLLGQRRLAAEQRQYGHDAAGAQDEAKQGEQRLAPVAARFVEPREQRLEEIHTTRPSLIWIMRWARPATPGSWVTSTIVWPAACSSANVFSTSLPALESRLPVGSSAIRIAGSPTSARAMEIGRARVGKGCKWRWAEVCYKKNRQCQ